MFPKKELLSSVLRVIVFLLLVPITIFIGPWIFKLHFLLWYGRQATFDDTFGSVIYSFPASVVIVVLTSIVFYVLNKKARWRFSNYSLLLVIYLVALVIIMSSFFVTLLS